MSPIRNAKTIFAEHPVGFPVPGKTTVYDDSETIDLENVPLNGGFIVKTVALSIDPYMRGRMNKSKGYAAGFAIGQPLDGFGLGVVVRSETDDLKVGQHVYGWFKFREYDIRTDAKSLRVIENKEGLPWHTYVGSAGMPGKTAFMAWKEYADAKKSDVVFVSGGAGPVGSAVVQLAKAEGLKVIASAGSAEKVAFLKEIGVDVAFNYKEANTAEIMEKEGPIGIYWDNVGGETLEAALTNAAVGARFIECGMISSYNATEPVGIKGMFNVIGKQIKMYGFIVSSLEPKYGDEFYKVFPAKLASGEIKYTEEVTNGLDKAGDVILAVQKGTNTGKAVLVVNEQ